MRAKISIIIIATLFITMGIIFYSCENTTSTDPVYPGKILGWVYDDSTKLPLESVKVWAEGIPDTLYTDLVGKFHYSKISMPRGEFVYSLIFQKTGYNEKSVTVSLKSDIEYRIDSLLMTKFFGQDLSN